jgi:hypothetical protein
MAKTVAAMLALALSAGFAPEPVGTADLAWLSGHWVQEGPGGWTEERWSDPRGGVMLGTGLSGKGAKATSFEFMRIADGPGGPVFWGSPGGKSAVAFPIAGFARRAVRFENPKHDYPTRIAYKREGGMLVATTSGPGGSNPQTWRYRRSGD